MTTGLLGFTSIEERGGGVRDYVSPSRLNCWLTCPQKFKARYIDGLPSPTTPALFLGRMTHRALEAFYRHRQLGITLPAEEVVERMLAGWAAAIDEENMTFESAEAEQANCAATLADLLSSENVDIAYWAATLLGRLGPVAATAVPLLTDAVAPHPGMAVSERAARALVQIGPAVALAVPTLQQAAASDSPRLARLANEALTAIQP